MTILAFGTDTQHFSPIRNNNVSVTVAGEIGPNMQTGVDLYSPGVDWIELPSFTGQSDLWLSFYFWGTFWSSPNNLVIFYGGGNEVFRVRLATAQGDAYIEIYNGATWDTVGDTAKEWLPINSLYRLDMHLTIADSGGVLEVYRDGYLEWSFTGDTLRNGQTTIDTIRFDSIKGGALASQDCVISHVVVSDTDSRAIVMDDSRVTADGNYTAWTGTFADVDELGDPDANFVISDTAAQRQSFAIGAFDSAYNTTGWDVIGLGAMCTAFRGPGGPQNLQFMCRSNSVDVDSPSLTGLDLTSAPFLYLFDQNPDGPVDWTFTTIDAAEIGLESVT